MVSLTKLALYLLLNLFTQIWDLSDPGGKGYLDKAGVFVALKLVALVQNGKEPSVANTTSINIPPPNMVGFYFIF